VAAWRGSSSQSPSGSRWSCSRSGERESRRPGFGFERGRSYRHALARLLDSEDFDRVVVPATAESRAGLTGDDLVWLLEKAPAEVLILRPGIEDSLTVTVNASRA